MNSLRTIAIFLMMAAVSLSGKLAYSQQEVDPDHFDRPAMQAQKAPVHHQKHAHATMARKGSASVKHHHGHAAA